MANEAFVAASGDKTCSVNQDDCENWHDRLCGRFQKLLWHLLFVLINLLLFMLSLQLMLVVH